MAEKKISDKTNELMKEMLEVVTPVEGETGSYTVPNNFYKDYLSKNGVAEDTLKMVQELNGNIVCAASLVLAEKGIKDAEAGAEKVSITVPTLGRDRIDAVITTKVDTPKTDENGNRIPSYGSLWVGVRESYSQKTSGELKDVASSIKEKYSGVFNSND